ncbi:hypothetical protein BUE80_DR012792 [Diplocarpon rosae]|nr:hypothetical protein BUE80_DR012792 [Diplocarpon rosae]
MRAQDLASFKNMPAVKGMPRGTAWGLRDKDGRRDSCGSLNLPPPDNAREAQKEIRIGQSVALKQVSSHPHRLQLPNVFFCFSSSSHEDIPDPAHVDDNSQHHWSERGGILGRAVLIDYVSWAEKNGVEYRATECHEISIRDVEADAKEQGVEFKPPDILIIRSGARDAREFVGLAGNEESVEWPWDHHFAAVAGDTITFEAWPPKGSTITFWPCRERPSRSYGIWRSEPRSARERSGIVFSDQCSAPCEGGRGEPAECAGYLLEIVSLAYEV